MHMIIIFFFFSLYDFVFIVIFAWFFEKGRFSRDLKEHSGQDGYEKGRKERNKKVLEKRLLFGKWRISPRGGCHFIF